jgi:hypothetical protein
MDVIVNVVVVMVNKALFWHFETMVGFEDGF